MTAAGLGSPSEVRIKPYTPSTHRGWQSAAPRELLEVNLAVSVPVEEVEILPTDLRVHRPHQEEVHREVLGIGRAGGGGGWWQYYVTKIKC